MKVYLAGPIEKSRDGGIWVRKDIRKILSKIDNIELLDPCDFEFNKQHKNLHELVQSNCKWRSIVRKVIMFDLEMAENVDVVIAIINKLTGYGTTTECIQAWRNNVPVIGYFSKDVYNNRDKLHPWLLASLAEECCQLEELEHIIKHYSDLTARRR